MRCYTTFFRYFLALSARSDAIIVWFSGDLIGRGGVNFVRTA